MKPQLHKNHLLSGALTFLGLFLLAINWPSESLAEVKKYQWVLEQKSDILGNIIEYISQDAAKIVNKECGYQIVAKAPDWTVHCFRPVEKLEWSGPLVRYNGAMIRSPFRTDDAPGARMKPYGKGVMKGLKYTRYSYNQTALASCYGADDITVSPKCAEFLSRCNDSDMIGKAPIYQSDFKAPPATLPQGRGSFLNLDAGRDLRSGMVIVLITKSWRKEPYNPAEYELPHAYKRLPHIEQVAFSPNQKKDLTDMFDGMGFSSDPKGSQKKASEKGIDPASARSCK